MVGKGSEGWDEEHNFKIKTFSVWKQTTVTMKQSLSAEEQI